MKPITVFRPFHQEVKFIITLSGTVTSELGNEGDEIDDELYCEDSNQKKVTALSAIRNVSTNLWPFCRKDNKKATKDGMNFRNTLPVTKKKILKRITPFVTVGKGYRNLLDRFTYTPGDSRKVGSKKDGSIRKGVKLKDANSFHALIWDSGYWDFG